MKNVTLKNLASKNLASKNLASKNGNLKNEAFLSKLHSVVTMTRKGATQGEREASLAALQRLTDRARIAAQEMQAEDAERFLAGVIRLAGPLTSPTHQHQTAMYQQTGTSQIGTSQTAMSQTGTSQTGTSQTGTSQTALPPHPVAARLARYSNQSATRSAAPRLDLYL